MIALRRGVSLVLPSVRPYLRLGVYALLIVYFTAQALTGERGLLNEADRERVLAERSTELRRLSQRRQELESRVRLLRADHLSADLLEERAREVLGFVAPGDYVVRLPRNETTPS